MFVEFQSIVFEVKSDIYFVNHVYTTNMMHCKIAQGLSDLFSSKQKNLVHESFLLSKSYNLGSKCCFIMIK